MESLKNKTYRFVSDKLNSIYHAKGEPIKPYNIMSDGIFISYRREDSSTIASLLYHELKKYFLAKNIFEDIVKLIPGNFFKVEIDNAIENTSILLILINKNWTQLKDKNGNIKLFDDLDFVRYEIEKAIEKQIEIIPILIENAKIPDRENLPESLWPILNIHFFELKPESIHQDFKLLINLIKSKRKYEFEDGTMAGEIERFKKDPYNKLVKPLLEMPEYLTMELKNIKEIWKKIKKVDN